MALIEGASWAPLPNDDIATIPIFLAPFTRDALLAQLRSTRDANAGARLPVIHKFFPSTFGLDMYDKDRLWFDLIADAKVLAWLRDAVQQTLGGVNYVNLNMEWGGKSKINSLPNNYDDRSQRRLFIMNPRKGKITPRVAPYGPTDATHKLPIDVTFADGAWVRNDYGKWLDKNGYERGPDWYDAGFDTRAMIPYNPWHDYDPMFNPMWEYIKAGNKDYIFGYGFDIPRYGSEWHSGNQGPVAGEIVHNEWRQFQNGMGLVAKVEQFDPATWGSLPVTSARNWNYYWGVAGEKPSPTQGWRYQTFHVDKWNGKPNGYGWNYPQMQYLDAVALPHLHIRTSDGYWIVLGINIHAEPRAILGVTNRICAVSVMIVLDNDQKFVDWEPFDDSCKGLRVARFSPRAGTNTVGLYEMSKNDIVNLNKDLYHTDLGEWAKQLFAGDGAQGLLGLRFFWGVRNKITYRSSNAKITIGANTMPNSPSLKTVNNEIVEMNMGSLDVPPVFGDHRDITVVDYKMWIPFVGMVDLNPHDVVGQKVALTYYINLVDGSAIAQVINCANCIDGVIFAQACDWGVEIPIRADARADAVMSAAMVVGKTIGGIAGGAIGGVPGAIAGGIVGAVSGVTQGNGLGISYSVGNLTPSSNMLTDFRPKLIMYKPDDLQDSGYSAVVGVPTAKTFEVGSVTGFLSAQAVQNTNVLPARYADEIVAALQSGVYLS